MLIVVNMRLWKDDLRHGAGDARYADGGVYKGSWRTGNRNGDGDMRFMVKEITTSENTSTTCGVAGVRKNMRLELLTKAGWLDDMRHGQGTRHGRERRVSWRLGPR